MPSKKAKKGPSTDKAKAIIKLRDELIAEGKDPEVVGLACKGMYKCDKTVDENCLDGIKKKLDAIKKGGCGCVGGARARARSRSPARARSPRRR
jgi:hypothetical protein